ncbi:flagellin [Paenibacillus pabuli]|uniref:flagellin N-terminal helical domain-containing protein n=1 Tax=Paenibacillus pabuli TaxID=1472 RepID=UPI001FFFEABE|nr:flagellin [Paenibacillus pabuli]UPK43470.1 flagellin [Paenibacillus pabuli]
MIINHNIAALNTHRQLGANTGASSKNLEKLSSGLRINRAGDDAAGLAISEKMRGQIRGLDMAQKNAQDGISLIQTAEGALTETHSILQRMRELSVQSSTDTNTDKDRAELQKEVDQLAQELTRIGKDTEFNTKKLLDGSFSGTFHIGANEGQNISLTVGDLRGLNLGVVGSSKIALEATGTAAGTGETTIADGTYAVSGDATDGYTLKDSEGTVIAASADGKTWVAGDDNTVTTGDTFTFDEAVVSGQVTISHDAAKKPIAKGQAEFANAHLQAGEYTVSDKQITDKNGKVYATSTDGQTFNNANGDAVLTLETAATSTKPLKLSIGGTDISSASTADKAITTINTALETVSSERAKLGAYQNRLEHTINNLGASSENLSAAESRIRDVDMAKEMVEFTKNNILTQAAQAMLAQANQQPQGVLQLLR